MTSQPVLPALERKDLDDEGQAVWDEIASRGPVAPMIKVLAHAPRVLAAYWQLGVAVNDHVRLPEHAVHLVCLRVCQLDGSHYGWVQRLEKATKAGVPTAKIGALANWQDSDEFDETERLALGLAEVVFAGNALDDGLRSELSQHFDPATIIGVSVLVRYYVMNHKYVASMHVTPQGT